MYINNSLKLFLISHSKSWHAKKPGASICCESVNFKWQEVVAAVCSIIGADDIVQWRH